jgi:hypothetical protein
MPALGAAGEATTGLAALRINYADYRDEKRRNESGTLRPA